ncbi:3-deoxy-D-manno-octulosonic acid kinase [Aliidiomarina sp. B3213]|nr:3-deoxy-D-manno-octulosonic acid kinase [Aliidiomarina sp. B3213]
MFVYHHILSEHPNLESRHFYPHFWQDEDLVLGASGGRNTVYFISSLFDEDQQWVLRHYYRGGLPGKLIKDQFLFSGYERTRAVREYRLLQALRAKGLPVPRVIAAHVARAGVTYRSNIIVERVKDSQDVGRILLEKNLPDTAWEAIGRMIASFHEEGLSHVDLNCKNILWQSSNEKAWLIDFDRCAFRTPDAQWQQAQLDRLLRSFNKESQIAASENKPFHFNEKSWRALLNGYKAS